MEYDITSTKNQLVAQASSLKQKKYRDSLSMFLIEGYHLCEMASDILYIMTSNFDYKNDKCKVYYVPDNVIEKISSVENSQGIIAVCKKIDNKVNYNLKKYLLCDGVSDPGNMGTIIRTCLAFNIDQVILSNNSVDIYNDKVIRGSQGAIFKIPVAYVDLKEFINKEQSLGNEVLVSTLRKDSVDLKTLPKKDKFLLVVGNEGQGVSDEITSLANIKVKISHSTSIDSLNVGVATSIMLFHLV